jgi:diguanylate cyclase (GGDEF)-like protein
MDTSQLTTSDLLVMLDVTRRMTEQRLVQPLLDYIATTIFEFIPAERCLVVLFADDSAPDIIFARDNQGQPLQANPDQLSRTILTRTQTSLTPLLLDDALNDTAFKTARSVRSLGIRSVMCVPLISYGHAIGAIYVENRSIRRRFREENLVPLILFANQVVVAIENARIHETLDARIRERTQELEDANARLEQYAAELHDQANRDSLTGLYNRRYFTELFLRLNTIDMVRRYKHPITLAVLDVDNFKHVNDTFLHMVGDEVLRRLANLLCYQVRETDVVARLGGEEFGLLLPKTSLQPAVSVCERLRQAVASDAWDMLAPGLQVTISIGVAEAQPGEELAEVLCRADASLYQAKRAGKNQVASFTE